ncbi:hypothetical protein QJQ45_016665, partial [Haematococcus lacustris]
SARAAVDKQQAAVHEQQQQAVGVWQCRLQVATGCRCAAVHEQQQQVAVHVLQWISSSSRLSCMNLLRAQQLFDENRNFNAEQCRTLYKKLQDSWKLFNNAMGPNRTASGEDKVELQADFTKLREEEKELQAMIRELENPEEA